MQAVVEKSEDLGQVSVVAPSAGFLRSRRIGRICHPSSDVLASARPAMDI